MAKDKKQKLLTLETLIDYNGDVFIPELKEIFVSKEDFTKFETEMTEFKNESLTNQDTMLKKLDILIDEKTVKDHQDKKQKKILEIHNESLRRSQILSPKELDEITKLEFF